MAVVEEEQRSDTTADTAPLAIRLFGPFEARLHGQPLPRLRSRKEYRLLALLCLRHDRPLERSWLAGTLWPDSTEAQALANLRNSLKDLRRALGGEAGRLVTPTPRTLALDLAGAMVDVIAFDAWIAAGDTASREQAIALYRGPLLEGWTEEWVFEERQIREQAYLAALETLAQEAEAQGEAGEAERYLRRVIAADPLRETAHRSLMALLGRSGRYAAVGELYRELRLLLHRELRATPAPETVALYSQLRNAALERAGEAGLSERARERESEGAREGRSTRELPTGTLTFLFTDIEGSTRLWEQHPETMRGTLARHHALLTAQIEGQGGTVVKSQDEGDSFFAVFARATDAVAAAGALQEALQAEEWPAETPLRVRVALHAGEAECREGDYYGSTVNRCARVRSAGYGGQVLLTAAVQQLLGDALPAEMSLRDLGEHRLKDLSRPERIYQLLAPGLPAEFPPLQTLDRRPHNLPAQTTPLVGRETEVAAVRDLLQREEVRLVTLTGPGGTGKTRLGLQVAADLNDVFVDGVFFVELAPIRDPSLVVSTVAQTLGVREEGGTALIDCLKSFLRERQLLLCLDNFEQVLEAVPLIAELVAAAPRLKVVVTSRAVLRLRGEHEFPVDPLALPDLTRLPPSEALAQYAAVELFVQRAVAIGAGFALTHENSRAVAQVCSRLDGLPLAIELAAARSRLFSPQALLARLENRLQVLTGGARDLPHRQQTLRNAIAWSYDLLEAAEQTLFRRLSVFVGGCTIEAAEAVGNATGDLGTDVLEGLTSLVEKSLLRQEEREGEPRFRILETLREYGRERLKESGEEGRIQQQHLRFFAEWAEPANSADTGADQPEWLDRIQTEHENLRSALDWSAQGQDVDLGLRLGTALQWFWTTRGHEAEGQARLAKLLGLPEAADRTVTRAKALRALGVLIDAQGDYRAAQIPVEESLEIARERGDREVLARSLFQVGNIIDDPPRATSLLQESLDLFRQLGHGARMSMVLRALGRLARSRDDYAAARTFYLESLQLSRASDSTSDIAASLSHLAGLASAERDYEQEYALRREALPLFRQLGSVAWTLNALGVNALHRGDYPSARAFHEESLSIWQELRERSAHARASAARILNDLGDIAQLEARYVEARQRHQQALMCFEELGRPREIVRSLEGLAGVVAAEGEPRCATRLLAVSAAWHTSTGMGRWEHQRVAYERHVAGVRAALGEEAFATAWAEGRAMTLDQAIAYALEGASSDAEPPETAEA